MVAVAQKADVARFLPIAACGTFAGAVIWHLLMN
jgi:hypothetical protein